MKTNWHLSRIKSKRHQYAARERMLKNKPYQCSFCKWRTESIEKMDKHIEKYNSIFIHEIPNPHKGAI